MRWSLGEESGRQTALPSSRQAGVSGHFAQGLGDTGVVFSCDWVDILDPPADVWGGRIGKTSLGQHEPKDPWEGGGRKHLLHLSLGQTQTEGRR